MFPHLDLCLIEPTRYSIVGKRHSQGANKALLVNVRVAKEDVPLEN
jgi:hypothetical protein